ncbi:MAG TPA: hypothetical protein VHL80_15440 [Polyangia bacterium]|nr:hypothetical protein [Polyangia bacterium]
MSASVAFLSGGRLHVKEGDEAPRAFDSRFGQSVRDRAVRSAQKNAWKTQGAGARFMGGAVWGTGSRDPMVLRIAITGVSRAAEPGRLLYALDTDDIVGLFSLDPATGDERRLFHSNDRRLRFPSGRPGVDQVVCSVFGEGGTANLGLMNADGSDLREITEGESLDLAPSWALTPDRRPQIVYQTAGLGRDRAGRVAGVSPFSAQLLDLETAELTTLLEDARHDFLGPRLARDGAVYAIRRPRRDGGASPWRAAGDAALFPLRMVSAVFGFLDVFSRRYAGKPLSSSGGAQARQADPRQVMIWGNLVDAEEAERQARRKGEDAPALVPASWKLVRRRPRAAVEELASGVLGFDLADDGSVVLTNGSAIDRLAPDGERARLWRGELIEQVVALD